VKTTFSTGWLANGALQFSSELLIVAPQLKDGRTSSTY
jgi:hypothetical protein